MNLVEHAQLQIQERNVVSDLFPCLSLGDFCHLLHTNNTKHAATWGRGGCLFRRLNFGAFEKERQVKMCVCVCLCLCVYVCVQFAVSI